MKILVVGLGSMGKRRIRLIRETYPEYTIYGVNRGETRRKEAEQTFGITCFPAVQDVDVPIDCSFICTAPQTHALLIAECLRRGWHVFSELNLIPDGYGQNMELAAKRNLTLFLSSTFLYREEPRYISSRITRDKKWNYIYHIGQYLPDWHPWEHYTESFLSEKRTGGCREIMAIELPWLTGAFGEIKNVQAASDHISDLEIPYHDNYMIQIRHENGNKGILVIDVVSPHAVRRFEAYCEGHYLSWDGTPETLREYHAETGKTENVTLREETEHKEGYRPFITENAYKNEIREFFDVVSGKKTAVYGFQQDLRILQMIDSIGG